MVANWIYNRTSKEMLLSMLLLFCYWISFDSSMWLCESFFFFGIGYGKNELHTPYWFNWRSTEYFPRRKAGSFSNISDMLILKKKFDKAFSLFFYMLSISLELFPNFRRYCVWRLCICVSGDYFNTTFCDFEVFQLLH